ncbi:emp24/gp25L/p24 family/GOLD-domain-containing protein, partial [Suillus paluster]|uniref:emp24/gp25L/p24 family/GOLD-domain-containing protein n=1 Tax=Suillus paluster TaxID=48578 RepID=UPI001B8736C7
LVFVLTFFAFIAPYTHAIKFSLPPGRLPIPKCIWNAAHTHALVIVTANVGPGAHQRVDIEILDSTPHRNVYLSKRDIKGETRLAVTAHGEGQVGVCFKNYLSPDIKLDTARNMSRTVDLDIDIGADAVDYNAIANQESLSGLETEMRKLEGIVKEIVDELEYLKQREERFADTNLVTNRRVQNFAWFTILSLTGLGVWQILHLRSFFKRKYLID